MSTVKKSTRLSFTFSGSGIDLQRIKELLTIPDFVSCMAGQDERKMLRTNYWALDSNLDRERPLSEHLDSLLSKLEPYTGHILLLARDQVPPKFLASVFVKQATGASDFRFEFSAAQLLSISALGAAVQVDVHIETAL